MNENESRIDKISKLECPECSGNLYWATIGYDEYGKIAELTCASCTWSQSEET
jgi:hypothetical protein